MTLSIVHTQEVLGKDFQVYGSVEEPLFLAKDVAEWIEHNNASEMLRKVDEDEKVQHDIIVGKYSTRRTAWFLTEHGVYEVLMQSRKPIAKAFKKEVKNILKQIRVTGGYIPVEEEESPEEFLARALLVAQKTLEKKDKLIAQQQKTIEIQAPKVERYEEYIDANGVYTSETLGKKLGFKSARAFNSFLQENKLIFKRGQEWKPSAKLPVNTYRLLPFFTPYNTVRENLRFTPALIEFLKNEELI